MTKKTIQNLLLIILFLVSTNVLAQEVFNINLSITDTAIMVKKIRVKKIKRSTLFAIKINAELNVPMLKDSVIFHSFNKYVPSHFFAVSDLKPDSYKYFSIPFMYVIEDKEGKIIPAYFALVSYAKSEVETRIRNERMFVSPKLEIERKLLTEQEQRDYDLAKYVVYNKKHSMVLYPLLGEYHFNLSKGEYYLYFIYSDYNPRVPPPEMMVEGKLDDGNVFRGYFVSNKVKLIVE